MMIIAIVGPYHDHLPEVEEEGSSNHQEYVSMICIKLNWHHFAEILSNTSSINATSRLT